MKTFVKLAVVALAALQIFQVDARPHTTAKASSSAAPKASQSVNSTANQPISGHKTNDPRAAAVKEAFLHAWNGYSKYAWGHDELLSVTNEPSDSRNGWGASIFDALDTLLIMGLDVEYDKALTHVAQVDFNQSNETSKVFETTIRYLGGLLSANDLRPNPMLVKQAISVAETTVLPAFKTSDGIPAQYVNVTTREPVPGNSIDLAEFGSLQMEMTRLSQVTGNKTYADIANAVVTKVQKTKSFPPQLYAMDWSLDPFKPDPYGTISISGGGDSYYEYLLKNYLLLGQTDKSLLSSWETAVESMEKYLMQQDAYHKYTYLSQITNGTNYATSGELICFLPGNVLLGAAFTKNQQFAQFGEKLMDGCVQIWNGTETGIAPETFHWIPTSAVNGNYTAEETAQDKKIGFFFATSEATYDLRPETLESLFYFYRLTGQTTWQDKAWTIFSAINKYCRTDSGFTSLDNVDDASDPGQSNFQESFFFAETLKYSYLVFADPSLISLNEWVFNTEAHPYKLSKPVKVQKAN
ncbi:hypothetical protein NQZ79_g8329 [Umbelopsis isabellina]|nr:hypothetical protein NQZ79_g8329 [Umbelopsis isabellina]